MIFELVIVFFGSHTFFYTSNYLIFIADTANTSTLIPIIITIIVVITLFFFFHLHVY